MTIDDYIITQVKEKFNVDVVGLKTKLIEDLGADSLDLMEFSMILDEQYDINIPDNDLTEFKTVGSIINYIKNRLNETKIKKVSTKN